MFYYGPHYGINQSYGYCPQTQGFAFPLRGSMRKSSFYETFENPNGTVYDISKKGENSERLKGIQICILLVWIKRQWLELKSRVESPGRFCL